MDDDAHGRRVAGGGGGSGGGGGGGGDGEEDGEGRRVSGIGEVGIGAHREPSSGSGAGAPIRPQGWSSFTRLLRNPSPPSRDPFPPLLTSTTTPNPLPRGGAGGARSNHHHHTRIPPAPTPRGATNSGERSGHGGNNSIEQLQRGVSNSPTSSTGSFSSNFSERNLNRVGAGHQFDVQAAFSSNAAAPSGGDQQEFAAPGSPPESSSGSFAPNANASSLVNSTTEHHRRGGGHRHGGRHEPGGGGGPASSAGSFTLNGYKHRVQSEGAGGSYEARGMGGLPSSSRVGVSNGSNARERERERDAPGGWKRAAQGPFRHQQGGEQASGGHASALKRRDSDFHEVDMAPVVDEGRRRGELSSAADADAAAADEGIFMEIARPTISDGRSSIGDADRDVNGAHEQHGKDAGDSTAASSAFHVPIEPEWEEDDMYLSFRSAALKESRARDKFARGAAQAYENGEHRKAKVLSRQAEERQLNAQKLHAEAAAKILNQRNLKNGKTIDLWHLDLHGLHSAEAVAAVESRLALLEHGLAENQNRDRDLRSNFPGHSENGGGGDHGSVLHQQDRTAPESEARGVRPQEDTKQEMFQSIVPASKLLSVVTGIGAHSQQGPTLPSAVKSFLINNGYQLEEPRAGVIAVRPKLRFSV